MPSTPGDCLCAQVSIVVVPVLASVSEAVSATALAAAAPQIAAVPHIAPTTLPPASIAASIPLRKPPIGTSSAPLPVVDLLPSTLPLSSLSEQQVAAPTSHVLTSEQPALTSSFSAPASARELQQALHHDAGQSQTLKPALLDPFLTNDTNIQLVTGQQPEHQPYCLSPDLLVEWASAE
eukprot:3621188-Pleurochrysis_carterae.AAC.1